MNEYFPVCFSINIKDSIVTSAPSTASVLCLLYNMYSTLRFFTEVLFHISKFIVN